LPEVIGEKSSQATTNSYVTALKLQIPTHIKQILVHIKELNVNAIKYKILASTDNVTYETLKAATTIAKNGSTYETLTDPWPWVDVQVTDDAGGTHGSVKVIITGS
jgi:hypothetical protein